MGAASRSDGNHISVWGFGVLSRTHPESRYWPERFDDKEGGKVFILAETRPESNPINMKTKGD